MVGGKWEEVHIGLLTENGFLDVNKTDMLRERQ